MNNKPSLTEITKGLPDQAREGFAYLAAFATYPPATFDVRAFAAVTQLPDARGLLEDYASRGLITKVGDRYGINEEARKVAESLCEP